MGTGANHRKRMASERQRRFAAPATVAAMKYALIAGCLWAAAVESNHAAPTNEQTAILSVPGTRYGLFNGLDSRSEYGKGVFPEPFLVDDSDLEPGEARLDWLRTGAGGAQTDLIHPEVEKGFGQLTLELEVPYERDVSDGTTTEGFGNIDLGARYPFYQFVSPNGFVDSTFGAGIEAGIPTGSPVGKNAELVPKIFDDLKLGNFTTQAIFGYSTLFGPGNDGGLQTFEYGFVFGYTIERDKLPLPGVEQVIPVFEVKGETELNRADAGRNSVLGDAALRLNLKAIGRIQPRPGIGFVFPLNSNARDETHWGVFTSLVFEF
jgi:hypothetical protein